MSLAAARQQFPHLRDYSDQELLGIVAQSNNIQSGSPRYKQLESELLGYDRSAMDVVKDTALSVGQGVMGLGKMVNVVKGALTPGEKAFDNTGTQMFEGWSNDLEQYKSQGLRNQRAGAAVSSDISDREAQANGAGGVGRFMAGAGAQLGNYWESPGLAFDDLAQNAPQLLAGGLAGRAVQGGATLLGAGATAATRAGVTVGVGSGGVMQGADVGAETYKRAIASGATHEQATQAATEAAFKSGAASVALSALPGAATVERSLLRGAVTPNRFGLGRAGTIARVGATELTTEGIDEGYGRFAGNQGVQQIDPNTDLAGGIGQAFVQGAAVGGPLGAGAGFMTTRPAPRTATGEIDLTGAPAAAPPAAPNQYDIPAYERRGLDPLNERSSPYPMQPDRTMADLVQSQAAPNPATYADLVRAPAAPLEADPFSTTFAAQDAQGRAQAQEARRAAAATGTAAQGPGVMVATPEGTVLPAQSPDQLQQTELARQAMATQPPASLANPAPDPAVAPNRGQLLKSLAVANTELGKNTVKKDGELSNTRGTAPLRAVLEAPNPLTAMRELHQDGTAPRDELLDTWHKNLTGKTVFEWKAEQTPAPALNSAGFVPEPAAQVAAQVDAVRDGRKPVAVLGAQEAITAELNDLASAVATGPDGATAVVVSRDPAKVAKAVKEAGTKGLKVAMGAALGAANPTLTSSPAAGSMTVQQVDNTSGQVIAEEVITKADIPKVKQVPGTTARVVPNEQVIAERIAATPAATQAAITAGKPKKAKAPKLGRKPTSELIEIAESSKDEAEYTEARYGLFKRWAEGDPTTNEDAVVGPAEAYLTDTKNKSALTKDETKAFKARHAAELAAKDAKKGQALGKKFGYRTGSGAGITAAQAKSVAAAVTRGWTNAAEVEVVATMADLPADLRAQAEEDGATNVKAAYADGKVWIVAGNHASAGDVVVSVLHEIAGHHGLRGLLGAQFKQVMAQIYNGNPDVRKAADAMIAAEGLDLETATEEVLADMAEAGKTKPSIVERIANALRQIMRSVGLGQFAAGVTNAEVAEVVAAARTFVEQGPATASVASDAVYRRESTITKPFSDAAKAVAASVTAQTSGKEISSHLLSMMTLRQIDEQFGKRLPALRDWIGAIMQRGSTASKLAAEADRVALQWEKSVKDPAERKALADVLLRASMAELQLDNTTPKYLATLDAGQRAEHAALNQKLAGMSAEARRTREQALAILKRQWEYTRSALETFINHTVPDPGLRNQRIEDLKREMGRNRGDYFPLSRFGDRIVIGRAGAKDGRDVVSFHESAASADAEVQRLKASGVKKIDVTLQTERDGRQRASTGFMGSLHQMIDGSEADGAIKDSMHQALQQLYLKSLPELSGAKHMIRRENVEGFSEDALRVFADSVTRGARYASHLEYGPAIQAAMESAEAQSRSSDKRTAAVVIGRKDGQAPVVQIVPTGTDRLNAVNSLMEQGYTTEFFNTIPESARERLAGALEGATPAQLDGHLAAVEQVVGRTVEGVEDMRAAKALYNHMVGLQKTEADQDSNKIVEALGQLGYTWYLGFSPAFWAMNTLQNPMIGIPHLGAKYGVTKAATEWMGAMKWFGGLRIGKLMRDAKTPFSVEWIKDAVKAGTLKGITKQELDMLQELEDRQVLDFTQAMDLSRIGQASSDKRYKFLRLAAAGAHHTEVFNRVTFALAAYRLAIKSDGNVTHAQAVRRAENDTAAVHFDYSYANKPEMMRGKSIRLIFMFQQYRQHMLYWWAKNIKDMVKNEAPGERTRALKGALLMGTTQAIFAGALGLPFVGAIGFIANLLGADDDDGVPFDFNRWITEAATDATGSKEAGEVMAKGIFAAVGMNIGQRIGQADLMPFLNEGSAKYERNTDDKLRAYLFDLGGPLGSILLGMGKASEAFARGDTAAGIAATTPKAASDIIKAYQLSTEGMKDKKGQFLATAEAFDGADIFMQAAGVAPTQVANVRADKGRIMDVDIALKDQVRRLTGGFTEAWMRGDRDGITEAVEEIKAFNGRVRTGKFAGTSLAKTLTIDGRQLEMAIKDKQARAMRLALSGGIAETKQQLVIATRMSGLFNPVTPESMRENAAGGLPGLPGLPGN